jgi:hypothetical protein
MLIPENWFGSRAPYVLEDQDTLRVPSASLAAQSIEGGDGLALCRGRAV